MRIRVPQLLTFALFVCLPLFAEDPIYGVWRMREDAQNPNIKSEIMKVEEVAGGTRFSMDVVMAKSKLSYYYVTKLDGQSVKGVLKKKPFSQFKVKKITPFEYETTVLDLTTEQNYKTTISPDGKTLTNDGEALANGRSLPVHTVFEKVLPIK